MKKIICMLLSATLFLTVTACRASTENTESVSREESASIKARTMPDMVFVEGGSYSMGSQEPDAQEDEILHTVAVDAFYMSSTEITQAMYRNVMGDNPSYYRGDDLPVEQVSWYDAIEFCNRLSEQEGLTPCYSIDKENLDPNNLNDTDGIKWTVRCDWSANGYRLPTEAEWEYAAKGGSQQDSFIYAGSDDLSDVASYQENSGDRTCKVASHDANRLGLYDMSGNVFEWCWDWYGTYPEDAAQSYGAQSGMYRVLRGGSWFGNAFNCRVANRHYYWPFFTQLNIGFRIVRQA